ncbi:hypothetical protein [Nocardia bovistercoris]|uniref:Uncharacterized protein n=1 Tax=Nocardia bovistercoris TaxID=2785916 RepID=A0A931IF05_9NOCA|nr:hypothetical protein [Nocardia bovistercoris]MBH0780041.1 hypothetical protein [Nocardia bovistercoris]
MTALLLALLLTAAFATVIVLGRGRFGSTDVVDRDAQRLCAELTAMGSADHR